MLGIGVFVPKHRRNFKSRVIAPLKIFQAFFVIGTRHSTDTTAIVILENPATRRLIKKTERGKNLHKNEKIMKTSMEKVEMICTFRESSLLVCVIDMT